MEGSWVQQKSQKNEIFVVIISSIYIWAFLWDEILIVYWPLKLQITDNVGTNDAIEQPIRLFPGGVFGPTGEQPHCKRALRGIWEEGFSVGGDDDVGKLVVILEQSDTTVMHD